MSRNSLTKHVWASPSSLNWYLAKAGPTLTVVMSAEGVIQCLDQGSGCQNECLSTEVIPESS